MPRRRGREGRASAAASCPHYLGKTGRTRERTAAARVGCACCLLGEQVEERSEEQDPQEPGAEEER